MKAKRILAICSLAAIVLSSTTALAAGQYTDYPGSGKWDHGTTRWDGGGTVYSYYYDWDHTYSYASVRNAKGVFSFDTQEWAQARAEATAIPFRVDHAYYNFWN